MVPLRDIFHCLFKYSLEQGVPQEEDNTVRGCTRSTQDRERVITGPMKVENERFPNQVIGILHFNQVLQLQF